MFRAFITFESMMMRIKHLLLPVLVSLATAETGHAHPEWWEWDPEDTRLEIEEPSFPCNNPVHDYEKKFCRENTTASGISNVRGWAIHPDVEISKIELYVDGFFWGDIPYGGDRADVGTQFPDWVNSSKSGFGTTFNFGELEPGRHTITIRAYDADLGNHGHLHELASVSREFTVIGLPEAFYPADRSPSFQTAETFISHLEHGRVYSYLDDPWLEKNMDKVTVKNVLMDSGELYDLVLKWATATQKFVVVSANEVDLPEGCERYALPSDGINFPARFTYWQDRILSPIEDRTSILELVNNSNADVRIERLEWWTSVTSAGVPHASAEPSRVVDNQELDNGGLLPSGWFFKIRWDYKMTDYAVAILSRDGKCVRKTVRRTGPN